MQLQWFSHIKSYMEHIHWGDKFSLVFTGLHTLLCWISVVASWFCFSYFQLYFWSFWSLFSRVGLRVNGRWHVLMRRVARLRMAGGKTLLHKITRAEPPRESVLLVSHSVSPQLWNSSRRRYQTNRRSFTGKHKEKVIYVPQDTSNNTPIQVLVRRYLRAAPTALL